MGKKRFYSQFFLRYNNIGIHLSAWHWNHKLNLIITNWLYKNDMMTFKKIRIAFFMSNCILYHNVYFQSQSAFFISKCLFHLKVPFSSQSAFFISKVPFSSQKCRFHLKSAFFISKLPFSSQNCLFHLKVAFKSQIVMKLSIRD